MDARDMRVLVVEDNRDAAESLRRLLGLCGFQVIVAHNAGDGLSAAAKLRPHIVLCDIGLPDAEGYVVASVLRQAAETSCARLTYWDSSGRRRPRA
jgi:DNA-binding response OmpR family regulator